ncbi:PEP-CTERM protein-sorting domain-containing protein [Prosthecobacter debontii]|uniref:PEP-CTERM protein-sorting domain-containing protein n=2 Tax=Prosthecobacter debontii TaxID=48467 RepID=A0A1T4XJ07_9BACT|nr:PEP-CTERM protein-sorting domain-containing protein [Prosthecobacter debontii]
MQHIQLHKFAFSSQMRFLFRALPLYLCLTAISNAVADSLLWQNPAGGDFNAGANWNPSSVPGILDTAVFNIGMAGNVSLSANATVGSVLLDTGATSFTLGALGGNTLTMGHAGSISLSSTLSTTGQAFIIQAPLVLSPESASTAGSFTIQNDSPALTTTLEIAGGISSGTTSGTMTLNLAGGNAGANTISQSISNGGASALALVKSGAGRWTLTGTNTYTGGTSITEGTLTLSGGDNRLATTSSVTFAGNASSRFDIGSTNQSLAGLTFATTGLTSVNTIVGSGTLTVTGGNIQVGGGDSTATSNAQTVDMSGLGAFVYNRSGGSFTVGGATNFGQASTTGNGVLSLAQTSTITAASFNVGGVSTGLSSLNTGTVHLGQTNTINASTIVVGVNKTTGIVDFQNLVDPTLKIRGTDGTGRASILVSTVDSGITDSFGTMDLTSGGTVNSTLDALVSTLTIGLNVRNSAPGKTSTGIFIMGGGTLDATTIILGQQSSITAGNSSGVANATLSLHGGTITAGTFTLADKRASATAQAINSTFNLYSGRLNATTIQRGTAGTGVGADVATINFNWVDGTISNITGSNQTVDGGTAVNGLTGGLNIVLNTTGNTSGTHTWNVSDTQTATVRNTVTLSGAGSLTKTGTGTLALLGANSYSGSTTISAGTVLFGQVSSLYAGATSAWTSDNITVQAGATAAFNVGGAGEFEASHIDIIKSLGSATGGFQAGSFLGFDTTNATGGVFSYGSEIRDTNNQQNPLGLVKLGTGTLELSGANTYAGNTLVTGGTLALRGGDNRLLSTGAVSFSGTNNSTLDIGNTSQTLSALNFQTTGTTSVNTITGAGGTLTVNGSNFQVGGGNATSASNTQTVTMSGLTNFVYNRSTGTFNVGGLTDFTQASTIGAATLTLAQNNTITASSVNIGGFSTGVNSLNRGTLHLGQTNTINASTIVVGVSKTTGVLDFDTTTLNPTLKIRATDGVGRASISVAPVNSGVTDSMGTVDLTSGGTVNSTLDALVSTLSIGVNSRDGTTGKITTASFIMGGGLLDATTIILGRQAAVTGANSSGNSIATLSLHGGTITVGTLTLADKAATTTAQTINSTFNLYSGTLNATTIQRGAVGSGAGANAATINFNWVDGTISNIAGANQTVSGVSAINGLTGGLNIVLNNTGNTSGTHTWNVSGSQTATIQDTVILSGAGSLTKTGTGILIYSGSNSYTGSTTVAEGVLQLNATGAPSIAGNLIVAGGTATWLQANQVNTASQISVSSGVLSLQGFNQTVAGVTLTGGSITSSTGVLTSTSTFNLQAGTVSGRLGGSAGIVKSTSGVVTLSGTNSFTGGTQVNGGTLIATSTSALGSNSGLNIASGAIFAYQPTAAGSLNLGTGSLTLNGGSTLGTAVAGTLSQSVIQSSSPATASGAITVDIFGIRGGSVSAGTHNLLTAAGGLTSGGATYSLGKLYNATNFTVSNFNATDTTISVNVASATALTSVFWKGGLDVGNNVWALSNGTASNWVTNSNGTGATALTPGAGATVTFSSTGATQQSSMILGAPMSVRNLVVNDSAGITLNADGNALTIADATGIVVNSGAGAVTLNANIILGASQTWTNNSANALTVGGNISGSFGLTKSGTGQLNLSGANTFIGSLIVTSGTLNVSGSATGATSISVANATNSKGILVMGPDSTINASSTSGLLIGTASGSSGAFYQNGGNLTLVGPINLGNSTTSPSYGFYQMNGGSLTDTGTTSFRFRMGGGATGSTGVFYQSGGSITISIGNGLEVGGNGSDGISSARGVAYFTGGSITALSHRIGYNNRTTNSGGLRGEQTVAGTSQVTINGNTILAQGVDDTGILNLNGGIYSTRQIQKGSSTGLSILNFNGGTLKAATSASGSTFLTGLSQANIYAGGATFDTSNQNLTIGQNLAAPTGNGVVTVEVTNGGSGYVGAPYISISGNGSGATAVANMVDDGTGNGTYKIASITITNAGTDYTGTPTVSLIGGGGSGVTFGTVTLGTNTSGGITKVGTGNLTLSGANSYTGPTIVQAGTLIAGSTSAFGVNSATTVNATLRTSGRNIALGSLAGSESGVVENASATAAILTVGGDSTSTIFSGRIQDGSGGGALSLVKVGSGVQTLASTNTYTGSTSITAGTLQVGLAGVGSTSGSSAVSVNGATAALAGTGIVNGSTTITQGFIRPGDSGGLSTGTLTLNSLNLTTNGTGQLQIQGTSSYDQIVVSGLNGLTLDGRLVVSTSLTGEAFNTTFADGATFDLLDWMGALSGSFDVGANFRDGSGDNSAQFDLPDLSSLSRIWDVSQFLTNGTISVTVVVVPEPSRCLFLLAALTAMVVRRRRSKK